MQNDYVQARIRALRAAKKISQQELGLAVGLSKQAVNGIEAGRRTTTLEKFIMIADYFGVSLDYLAGRTDKQEEEYRNTARQYSPDILELIEVYSSLDDLSKGSLLERARILYEDSLYRKKAD